MCDANACEKVPSGSLPCFANLAFGAYNGRTLPRRASKHTIEAEETTAFRYDIGPSSAAMMVMHFIVQKKPTVTPNVIIGWPNAGA
jgi:hypothetical protein